MNGLKQTTEGHPSLIIYEVRILLPGKALLLCIDNWPTVNTKEFLYPHYFGLRLV